MTAPLFIQTSKVKVNAAGDLKKFVNERKLVTPKVMTSDINDVVSKINPDEIDAVYIPTDNLLAKRNRSDYPKH